jgi:hypothetical protein
MSSRFTIKSPAAYSQAVHYYRADTDAAWAIVDFILSHLKPALDGSGSADWGDYAGHAHLYHYDYAGITGRLARRVDKKGRILFAVYTSAPHPVFLTAPNVWAHLNGYRRAVLSRDEYAEWKERLEQAAGVIEPDTRPEPPDSYLDRSRYLKGGNGDGFEYAKLEGDEEDIAEYEALLREYRERELLRRFISALPTLPDPFGSRFTARGDEVWAAFERCLGRRLYLKRRQLIYRIWRHLVRRWIASARAISDRTGRVRGWPCAIEAADVYLAKKLEVDRNAAARAIKDLDRMGYIQAVMYKPKVSYNKPATP